MYLRAVVFDTVNLFLNPRDDPVAAERACKRRTLQEFGDICVKYNVSHRLGNALLAFSKSLLVQPRYLPRDMRTVFSRYDAMNAEDSHHSIAAGPEVDPSLLRKTLDSSSLPGSAALGVVSFIYHKLDEAIKTLVESTGEKDVFNVRGTPTAKLGAPHTAKAWQRHEALVKMQWGSDAIFVALLWYADETMTRSIRGQTYYPVVLALANHELQHRYTRSGKYILAYLPVLKCPSCIKSETQRRKFGLEKLKVIITVFCLPAHSYT
jgi:hypothetical protein